jgi:hypothetical protein
MKGHGACLGAPEAGRGVERPDYHEPGWGGIPKTGGGEDPDRTVDCLCPTLCYVSGVVIHIAFVTWFLAVLALFWTRAPREAVVASLVVGWLFLPVAGYPVTGLHSKTEIVALGVLVASLLLATEPWRRFRPSLLDLPVLVACLAPFASSVTNDLGLYNAGSDVLARSLKWGVPYLLGRVYLSDLRGLRAIATGAFLGGLAYVPLCLLEIRLSPQLHRFVYGYHQHEFIQTIRWGGFRPMVFMQHGLAVGLWMTAACLAGFWLWRTGARTRIWGIPISALLAVLVATTLLVKSAGALILLALGVAALVAARSLRTSLPVVLLLLAAPTYIAARTSGLWSGRDMVELARRFDPERADSLRTRLDNEDDLVKRAMEKKAFGWGGWGRAEIKDEEGRSISIRDGLWVIVIGESGLVGLVGLNAFFLLPVVVLLWRYRSRLWRDPALAPAAAIAVLLPLVVIDSLLNAFGAPLFTASAGAIAGFALRKPMPARRRAAGARRPDRPRSRALAVVPGTVPPP